MKKKLLSIMALLCAVVAWGQEDVTSTYLQNADFASLDGWTFTSTKNNAGKNDYENYKTDGDVPALEFYHTYSENAGAAIGTTYEFQVSQTVTLPAGEYRIAVNAFYREGSGNGTNEKAYIFAGGEKQYVVGLTSAGVNAYTGSNDLYRAANAFSKGDFLNEFDFTLEEEQTLDLGIKGYMDTYCSWCILGPVKLYKYSLDAYKSEYEGVKAQAEVLYDTPMEASVLEALKAAVVDNSEFTASAEYKAAIADLKVAVANAEASAAAYAKLGKALEYAENFPLILDDQDEALVTFNTAIADIKAAYTDGSIAENDIAGKVDEVNAALRVAVKAQTTPGSDMTPAILNNSFETGNTDGWTTTASSDTGARTNSGAYATEGTDGDYLFNTWWKGTPITQTITDLPNGTYRLEVLVSSNGGTVYLTANGQHNDGTETGGNYPSSDVFQEASFDFEVTDGTATIGVVGGADGEAGVHKEYREDGYWWYKADNFRLTYLYSTAPAVADLEPTTVDPANNAEVAFADRITLTFAEEVQKGEWVKDLTPTLVKDDNEDIDISSMATGNSVMITLSSYEPITEAGTYVLTIPAGLFGDLDWAGSEGKSGHYNAELTYTFTVTGEAPEITYDFIPTLDPAEGSVSTLEELILTCPDEVYYNADMKAEIKFYNKDTEEESLVALDYDNSVYENLIMLFDPDFVTKGTYVLELPEGLFGDKTWNNGQGGRANPALRYEFTVVEPATADLEPIAVDPANGAVVSSTFGIKLTFAEEIQIGEWVEGLTATLVKDGSENIEVTLMSTGNGVTVMPTTWEPIEEPGVYELTIPAGLFGDLDWAGSEGKSGHYNAELTYTFTVTGEAPEITYDFIPTLDPAEGSVSTLEELILTCPDEVYYNADMKAEIKFYNKDTEEESLVALDYDNSVYENLIMLFDPDFVTKGTYVLELPEGLFGDKTWNNGQGGRANPALRYEFIVTGGTGIASVAADAAKVDVYTLNGVLVLKNADREALKNLKKGIYVINGKKVILK